MKKLLTYSVVIATIAWSLGLAAVVPVATAAYTPTAGDLVKTANDSAVYYIDADGKRHLMVNEVTFWTWYSGTWSSIKFGNTTKTVKTITQTEFEALGTGANVTARPGVNLVRFQNSPKAYAVLPGAKLAWVSDEATAKALYGDDWSKKVVLIQNGFENNYTKDGELTATSAVPDGSLIKYEGSSEIYYIEGGEKRLVGTEAFIANGFKDSAVLTAPTSMSFTSGDQITGEEAGLTTVAGVGSSAGNEETSTGTVSVSLSSDNPASAVYLKSQALAPFLTVSLVNNSSGDVVIDAFQVERGGLGLDTDFSSVAAYENSVTGDQIGLNKTFNSDHRATFGDDVIVKAGTTKKLVIVGNISSTTKAGNTPKLGLYSMTLKGTATLSASLPIWGNTMNFNDSVTIATATVAAGASNPTTDTAPKVGDTNVEIAETKITNNSTTSEEAQIEKMVFRQAGTVSDSDVSKYVLVDSSTGTTMAEAVQVDKYINFVFATPYKIGKGKNVTFMVKAAEIVGGSSRTIQLDIYRDTDVLVKGLTYGAYVVPTFPASSQPYLDNTVSQTIGNGSLKVEASSTFVAKDIPENQAGVQLGEWLFTVKGEPVNITNIEALLTITDGDGGANGYVNDITNAVFYDVTTGTTLAGPSDPTGGDTALTGGVTSTDTVSLPVGVHKVGLKADLNADFGSLDTIKASIDPDTDLTVTGDVTGNTITASPTSYQASALLTVKAAKIAISVSPLPAPSNVIAGSSNVEVARVILDASGSGDDVKVTQFKTDIRTSGSMYPNRLSGFKLYDGSTELELTNDPDPTSTTAAGSASTTWSLKNAVVVAKGTVKTLSVTVNVSSGSSDTFHVGGCSALTAKDTQGEDAAITYNYSGGQQRTVQTAGTLTLTRSDDYSSTYLIGNTAGVSLGKLRLTAGYENVKVEKMYVDFASYQSGGTDEINAIYLYDGSTLVSTAAITSSNAATVLFDMSASPVTVSAGTPKELTIKVDTGIVDMSGTYPTNARPTQGFTTSVDAAKITAKGVSGQNATVTTGTLTFPTYALVASLPIVTVSTPSNVIGNGTRDLITVKVAANSKGPVGLYKMRFVISTSTVSVDPSSLAMYEGSTLVATVAANGGIVTKATSTYDYVDVLFNQGCSSSGCMREIQAGAEKTYTLKGTVSGYVSSTGGQVSTVILGDNVSSGAYENAVAVDALTNDHFIWSDLSYGNTSTTATTTAQWLNGYSLDTAGGLLGTTSTAITL